MGDDEGSLSWRQRSARHCFAAGACFAKPPFACAELSWAQLLAPQTSSFRSELINSRPRSKLMPGENERKEIARHTQLRPLHNPSSSLRSSRLGRNR